VFAEIFLHVPQTHNPKEINMLKKTLEWTIPLALAGIMTGCATYRPPAQIQSAVATVNRHTPEYVTEANKALREIGHPDAERLTGVGLRLQTAVDALDQWANGSNQEAGQ
jgi:hypothetical protein